MTTSENNKWESRYNKNAHEKLKKSRLREKNEVYTRKVRAVRLVRDHFLKLGWNGIIEIIKASKRSIQRWVQKVNEWGFKGLQEKSKRPYNIHTTPPEIVHQVIEIRDRDHEGCEKIALTVGLSSRTVHKILKKAGKITESQTQKRWKHYQRNHSNSLWQMDFTYLYEDLWLFLIIDDHSRFIIGFKLMPSPNTEDALDLLDECIGKHGPPREILTDHGVQFYSTNNGISTFEMFCEEMGIKHIMASIRHPQTNGKVERKIGVVSEHLELHGLSKRRIPTEDIQRILERFTEYHNYSRWHFTYEYTTFGDIEKRRKVAFLPILRYGCHRN